MVIYRVVVYQERLFLSSDAHQTVIQLVGSRGASERVPLAERSICRLLKNSCFCCKTTKEEAEYMVYCPISLGALLLVHLEAPSTTASVWFCSKVAVTTPEGGVSLFPCYRFVSRSTSLSLRDSIAKFIFNDVRPLQLDQRVNELTERRQTYRWSCYDDGLPETMKADDIMSLPAEARFSVSKATNMIMTVSKVGGVESSELPELSAPLVQFSSDPSALPADQDPDRQIGGASLEGGLVLRTSVPERSQPNSDLPLHRNPAQHGRYRGDGGGVAGGRSQPQSGNGGLVESNSVKLLRSLASIVVVRCVCLFHTWQPRISNTELSDQNNKGQNIKRETGRARGNVFLVDYRLLDALTANTVNRKQNYLTAPLVLLHLNTNNQLLPIAIQLNQSPGESNPVFVPQDLEADWLTAKTFVRSADFADHELRSHFLRTHMMSELFAMATLRNFPMVHPLYKLLAPHFRFTLEIDTLARQLLLSDGGSLKEYTAVGGAATLEFLRRALASLTYRDLCLPDDITGRGLDSIPGYYYRDDGLRLWDVIHRYVGGVVSYYYHSDDDVIRDSELQSWINEIIVFGRLGDEKKGFPKSLTSVLELTYFVTMVIFNASAQHAAVNDAQLDYFGWMPNAPVGLQCPPPACKGRCSERSLLDSFPDVNSTVHGLAAIYLLSKKPADFVPLGGSAERHFTEAVPVEMTARFRSDLKRLSCDIRARNVGLKLPYVYLDPATVEDSVTR